MPGSRTTRDLRPLVDREVRQLRPPTDPETPDREPVRRRGPTLNVLRQPPMCRTVVLSGWGEPPPGQRAPRRFGASVGIVWNSGCRSRGGRLVAPLAGDCLAPTRCRRFGRCGHGHPGEPFGDHRPLRLSVAVLDLGVGECCALEAVLRHLDYLRAELHQLADGIDA